MFIIVIIMSIKSSSVKFLLLLIIMLQQGTFHLHAYDFDQRLTSQWHNDTITHAHPYHLRHGGIDLRPGTFQSNEMNYYRFMIDDFRDVISSPFHWRSKDWFKMSILVAGTGLLIAYDDKIYDFIQSQRTPFTKAITKFPLEPLGHYAGFSVLAGMYTYGHFAKKGKPQATALLAAESYLIAGLLVQLPKFVFGRSRPQSNNPPDHLEWQGPGGGSSFWSGHTTSAFAIASVIASMYNDKKGIQIAAYTIATMAGLSRIHDQKHWASDVLVGAVVGTAIGKMVVKNYKSRSLKLMPVLTPEFQALNISYTF